jgi:hypothetical protein
MRLALPPVPGQNNLKMSLVKLGEEYCRQRVRGRKFRRSCTPDTRRPPDRSIPEFREIAIGAYQSGGEPGRTQSRSQPTWPRCPGQILRTRTFGRQRGSDQPGFRGVLFPDAGSVKRALRLPADPARATLDTLSRNIPGLHGFTIVPMFQRRTPRRDATVHRTNVSSLRPFLDARRPATSTPAC